MITSNDHLLFISEDNGNQPALAEVTTALHAGAHVTWICSTATSSTFAELEQICALKNRRIAQLNLLVVTHDEMQPFDILTGPLNHNKLAQCSQLLFDPDSVSRVRIAAPTKQCDALSDWARDLLNGVTIEPLAIEQQVADDAQTPGQDTDTVQVTVILQGREQRFAMKSGAGTLLDGADDAGIDLPFSCRGGVCSTCRAHLVDGEVELLENYALEDWELEAGFTLPCQAEPVSPKITLDYDQV